MSYGFPEATLKCTVQYENFFINIILNGHMFISMFGSFDDYNEIQWNPCEWSLFNNSNDIIQQPVNDCKDV